MIREDILKMLEERQFKELRELLENTHPVDIAELMEEVDARKILLLFRLLDKDRAAETFTEMSGYTRELLIDALTDSAKYKVINIGAMIWATVKIRSMVISPMLDFRGILAHNHANCNEKSTGIPVLFR